MAGVCDQGGECHHPIACSEGPCVKTRGPVKAGKHTAEAAKLHREASARRARIRAVAKGATINGTYRLPPGEALDAFRADLLKLVGE